MVFADVKIWIFVFGAAGFDTNPLIYTGGLEQSATYKENAWQVPTSREKRCDE